MSEEKKSVKQEKAAAPKRTGKNSTPGPVVYIGPPLRGVVQANVVFNNGLSAGLKRMAGKHPVVASLIVPAAELGAARAALKDGSSALSACYGKVLEIIQKEGKEC